MKYYKIRVTTLYDKNRRFRSQADGGLIPNVNYYFGEIVEWKNSKSYVHFSESDLFLQYIEEKDKFSKTSPTSIRILDIELANDIFGFYPKYVNYDFMRDDNLYAPRFYVPYSLK